MPPKPLRKGAKHTFYRLVLFQPTTDQLLHMHKTDTSKLMKNFCYRFVSKTFMVENPGYKIDPGLTTFTPDDEATGTLLNPFSESSLLTQTEW